MSGEPTNPFAPPTAGNAHRPKTSSDESNFPTAEGVALKITRLLFMQGAIAVALSVLVGAATTVQFSFGLAKFGGLEYLPRVLVLSMSRVFGTGVSASASLFALLVWTHPLDENAIRPSLLRAAAWCLGVVILMSPIAATLAIASGFLTSRWAYGVPWDLILASRWVPALADLPAIGLILVQDVALAGAFCWFALPLMTRRSWSLLRKFGATWTAFAIVQIVSKLAAAMLRTAGEQ